MRTNKPLVAKTQLRAKTALKAKTALAPSKTPKKQPKPTITKLKKQADVLFSKYVRYRDSTIEQGQRWSRCITCGVKLPALSRGMQNGHFMNRQYGATRYEEENNNAQCYRCNMLFNGEQYKYAQALDLKYGDGTATKLYAQAKTPHHFTEETLNQVINDAIEQIKFYESQT